ncbi:MAG: cell division protein ZapA [Defluviicoccus sp.]|nr:cell division protein ZapA [Defluviicoccus sp.]MDG4593402.1 cell division protein ZapA [Defluviicoccus sp.]MDS4011502.1 cell division protein ZapA [Defluviicoccus sp.]MDS4074147.1 cell division protein ZapA [Defluviicoccus sp.]
MPDLEIVINGKPYTIRCNDGEEAHVTALAHELDARAKRLLRGVGPVDEARLLVMVALILADELHEARSAAASAAAPAAAEGADDLAQAIDAVAARIEAVAARLHAA